MRRMKLKTKVVSVRFKRSNDGEYAGKTYDYCIGSNINMSIGGVYDITADGDRTYSSPVKVISFKETSDVKDLRTITKAICIEGAPRAKIPVKKVVFNEKKRTTTVVWESGRVATIHCAEGDEWDEEKALALCIVKGLCQNKSYYNDYMRDWIKNAERH